MSKQNRDRKALGKMPKILTLDGVGKLISNFNTHACPHAQVFVWISHENVTL